jgi:hypothetical protein
VPALTVEALDQHDVRRDSGEHGWVERDRWLVERRGRTRVVPIASESLSYGLVLESPVTTSPPETDRFVEYGEPRWSGHGVDGTRYEFGVVGSDGKFCRRVETRRPRRPRKGVWGSTWENYMNQRE